jgi:hypothetical protein
VDILITGSRPLKKQTDADLIPELSVSEQGFGSFRFASNPSRIDAKRGNHFLQADFSLPIACTDLDYFRFADNLCRFL